MNIEMTKSFYIFDVISMIYLIKLLCPQILHNDNTGQQNFCCIDINHFYYLFLMNWFQIWSCFVFVFFLLSLGFLGVFLGGVPSSYFKISKFYLRFSVFFVYLKKHVIELLLN